LIFNVKQCPIGILETDRLNNLITPNPFSNSLNYSFGEVVDITISNSEGKIIQGAHHQFAGYEEDLAKEVLKFI